MSYYNASTDRLPQIYDAIAYPFSKTALMTLGRWRDVECSKSQKDGRIIATSLGLAIVGVAALTEAVVSAIFGILTLPTEVLGYHFARHFFSRALNSSVCSLLALTYFQFTNIADEKIFQRAKKK